MSNTSQTGTTTRPRPRRRILVTWPELLLMLVLMAGLFLDQLLGLQLWPVLLVLLGLTYVAMVIHVVYYRGWYLVGPLFFYDVVRLARRGRSTLLRVTFGLTLFAGLCFVYDARFPQHQILRHPFAPGPTIQPQDVGRFANAFVGVLLTVQALAVLVLTPAYLAGAIAEEKERRTLDLLFTTHLTDREIILGKLCARLLHLGGVLLIALPVLAILQLWGGANPLVIVAAFAACGFSLLSIGSISILCSMLVKNVVHGMLFTYALVLLGTVCCFGVPGSFFSSPLAFVAALDEQLGMNSLSLVFASRMGVTAPASPGDLEKQLAIMVATYGICHGLVAAFCLTVAVVSLRSIALSQYESGPVLLGPEELSVGPVVRASRAKISSRAKGGPRRRLAGPEPMLEIGTHPLLWKELYQDGKGLADAMTTRFVIVFLLIPTALYLMSGLEDFHDQPLRIGYARFLGDYLHPTVRAVCVILAGLWATMVGFQAGRAIVQEREMQTLDSLLSLPVERESILGAKWLGSILRGRKLAYVLAGYLALGLVSGALHPLGFILLALAIVIHIAFLATLGLSLSLVSRNTLWANFTMALVLLLTFVGSWVVLMYSVALSGTRGVPRPTWWDIFAEFGLNPPRTWWHLAFSWKDYRETVIVQGLFRGSYGACLLGMLAFAVATGVFWWAARWRFRGEQGGT
jgi:ABC-type transport system involved in multi-copper enzyme maturation permease subunit